MNKSNINVPSAGTTVDNDSTAQNQRVSQPNANTNVSSSLWGRFDEEYDEYSEPEICPLCGFNEDEDEEHDVECPNNDSPFSLLFREGFD